MKRMSMMSVTIAICLGYAVLAAAQIPCVLTSFSQLPSNTGLYLGPDTYIAAVQYPEFGLAIAAARDAWNATDAAGIGWLRRQYEL